jgi:light-regulated signal transduction histidine kinase (bacteriophytochrome)
MSTSSPQALQQRINELEAQLAAVNRELQSIAYAVSHDLRAPLRSIAGFSQVLQEEAAESLSEEHRGHLHRIQDSTNKLSKLIDGLLELSRAGSTELQLRPVNVTDEARAIFSELPHRPAAMRIEVQSDMSAYADLRALQAVLKHLLHNATKVTAKRSNPHVTITQEQRPRSIVLCVADNGVGFDPRYAEKLFTPFQRLHADPSLSGTGIGLALVQRLVARHNGSVWAESQPDAGAKFYVELPRGP